MSEETPAASDVRRASSGRKPGKASGASSPIASRAAKSGKVNKAKAPRREQQRAVETKRAILEAALQEFARKGFDAASMRDIAERLGIQHPLITYHYRTKETLWRAVAEHIMAEIQEEMEARTRNVEDLKPVDRVRAEFRALLSIQFKYPHFHHFMLNESRGDSPRLQWLAQHVLAPTVNWILPEIRRAQSTGDLPQSEPVLLHYLLVGMTSILMSVAAEIEAVTGFSLDAPDVEDKYFALIDSIIFSRNFGTPESSAIADPALPANG